MPHQPTSPRPPDAWLVVKRYGDDGPHRYVVGAFPSESDPDLLARVAEENDHLAGSVRVVLDDPSLDVCHYGIVIRNPCWLAARDIWFERYASILDKQLVNPRVAQVFTFHPGTLEDPLVSHKSSARGPFSFPRGASWPTCGSCHTPMVFFGALDFRNFTEMSLPGVCLVLHVCAECGVVADLDAWKLTWIKDGEPVDILGDRDRSVLVGRKWLATEYPTPPVNPEDLVGEGPFLDESSIYFNFSCFADKVGGHVFRIQGHDGFVPADSKGDTMTYIGQFCDSPDIEIGDCGLAYIYYSPGTGETVMYPEGF